MKQLLAGVGVVVAAVFIGHGAQAQTSTDISLVHGIPGVTVDVSVNGAVVLDDFVPGSIADISSFAGRDLADLTVTDSGSGDVLIGPVASVSVPATGSWSYVAHLDASGNPVLATFENNNDETDDGEARVTLRHTAEAPAIDLIIGDTRPIVGATNGNSVEIELPDDDLADASIAPTGDVAIAEIATLDLAADTNTIIYVVGSTEDDTIDFVVQIVEAPVAAPPATTTTTPGSTTTVPQGVNTGSPLGGTATTTLVVTALGALAITGGALFARRRI